MDSNQSLIQQAERTFKPTCLKFIPIWLQTATKNEIKGFKVIQAIVKHKGTKRFRQNEKPERFDLEQAAVDWRQRTMQSYYSSQYSSVSPERSHESEILKFKKFSELKYTQILSEKSIQFIEKWLLLGDEAKFKDLLLLCLQGIFSVCKINENLPVTNNQENFHWFSKEERARGELPSSRLNVTHQNFHSGKKNRSVIVEIDDRPMKSFYEPRFFQERMIRRMRGSGDFINWVYDQNASMYQNAFSSKINNNPAEKAKPANSSTVIRVLPINSIVK